MEERRCAICGEGGVNLVRDHDHKTGEIRGWLCPRCNVMLGYAADSQERLVAAATYLASTDRQPRPIRNGSTPAKRDRAAYMREYRKRGKVVDMTTVPGRIAAAGDIVKADLRIRELEAEVRHLKAEVASAHDWQAMQRNLDADIAMQRDFDADMARFNTRPFTPVPKVKPPVRSPR